MKSLYTSLLAGAVVSILAGCASAPAPQADVSGQQFAAAAPTKCHASDAPTGSSIVRKDCSSKTGAVTVDAEDLMSSKRVSVPDPSGHSGR